LGPPLSAPFPERLDRSGTFRKTDGFVAQLQRIERLIPGSQLLVGGSHAVTVSEKLAQRFKPGDTLTVAEATGELLHIPAEETARVDVAVGRAHRAFARMGQVNAEQISEFYARFAANIADDAIWQRIALVNQRDVEAAQARGRTVTRLKADDRLRDNVVRGLSTFASAPSLRGKLLESVQHEGWVAELVGAELGVIGFVFEGRPNVVADATGVLRGGNTVVFRIGSDALGTAKAMLELALEPALRSAGLPEGAVSLVESASHAAGWALFSDRRLSLAVARGSGEAVATLGGLARRAGIPVSLHGKGGAWMFAAESATPEMLERAVFESLDRKVCNTLNTLCLTESKAAEQVRAAIAGLTRAAEQRGQNFKLHVVDDSVAHVPQELFEKRVNIRRASGDVAETQAERLELARLGDEWEWEESPEVTFVVRPSVRDAIGLFNEHSPLFVACLLSTEPEEHERFFNEVNAPFVGDGFTRWVDGQFALNRPELGLSNWEHGRLFGRGGVLSGDAVFTVRTRYRSLR
jgi:glutamate-5-semialdehyde dehydrogenase